MTADEVRQLLRAKVENDYGCVKRAAYALKTDDEHLRKQMNGMMRPGLKVLKWLGIKRVFAYEKDGMA